MYILYDTLTKKRNKRKMPHFFTDLLENVNTVIIDIQTSLKTKTKKKCRNYQIFHYLFCNNVSFFFRCCL